MDQISAVCTAHPRWERTSENSVMAKFAEHTTDELQAL
jgi:hypothetical protein